MGLHFHAGINDFIELLHGRPTMAEAPKSTAISRCKDPSKLSCCAEYNFGAQKALEGRESVYRP